VKFYKSMHTGSFIAYAAVISITYEYTVAIDQWLSTGVPMRYFRFFWGVASFWT